MQIVRESLAADDACLIDATGGSYERYGATGCDHLTETTIWAIQRELVSSGEPRAFRVDGGMARAFRPLISRARCDHAAALLPIAQAPAHLLLLRGDWSRGFGQSRADILTALLPSLARLAERRKTFADAVADRALLSSMHDISMADGIEATLQRGARMIATLAAIDYVTLTLADHEGRPTHTVSNITIPARFERPDGEAPQTLAFNRWVIRKRRSMVFEDAQRDERLSLELRRHLGMLQIHSIAVLPLAAGDRGVGTLTASSARPRRFDSDELAMLEALGRYVGSVASGAIATDELVRTEERLRVVALNAPIVLFSIDRDGRFTLSEGRGLEALGLRPGEVVGRSVFDVYASDADVIQNISRALSGETLTSTTRVGDMTFDTHYAPIIDATGEVNGVVGVATDVTQRTRALEQLAEQARRDALTGVLNHAAITRVVDERIRSGEAFAVAMLDVDGMKVVNDTYGHLSGDALLRTVADALASGQGITGRYGGDEFLVVLPDADRASAEAYATRMANDIHETKLIDAETGATIRPPVSIGVAVFPDEASTLVDLIRVSDGAMYAAKSRRAHELGLAARRLDERVAAMIGDLVPLLTSPGSLDQKLKLVAGRLSTGTGYDAVDCQVFHGGDHSQSALEDGQAGDRTLEWQAEQRAAAGARSENGINIILERTRRPLVLEELASDERLTETQRQVLKAAGLQSAVVAPMLWNNELIGTLAVARRARAAFDARDAQFLAAVASQVTAIVRMAGLVDSLQKATDRLSGSQAETVMMLAAAAEAHDHTTGLHLQSIRSLSEAIAEELGYPPSAVRELGLAATLHDIGKISVPDSVLSSPLRFDSDDWEIARMWQTMKRHSIWGAEFLAGKPGFELAAKVARWHHERWDGGGYPDGIAGDQIPEEVSIVTVADAFDAMVQDRPYRAGRPAVEAIQELLRCRGEQFNPDVVDAVVRLYERGALPLPESEERLAA